MNRTLVIVLASTFLVASIAFSGVSFYCGYMGLAVGDNWIIRQTLLVIGALICTVALFVIRRKVRKEYRRKFN